MDNLDTLYQQHFETVCRRVDAALAATGFESLVIHSGVALHRFLDDLHYPFTANPHIKTWAPILEPDNILIYVPGRTPRLACCRSEGYWEDMIPLPSDAWIARFETVLTPRSGHVKQLWSQLAHPAFIGPAMLFTDEPLERVNPPALLNHLHYHRAVKTPYEIECLRRASKPAALGHIAARRAFEAGHSEFEILLAYLQASGQRETQLPYDAVVAINENAAVLHHLRLETTRPQPARSCLIDAGAQCLGYASDVTRTYAATDGLFAELVQRLDAAQQVLCDRIRAGTDYRDHHIAAHLEVGRILRQMGLITACAEDALETGLTAIFFPHGLGHLLGLQVHDVGGQLIDPHSARCTPMEGHPTLRMTRPLEPGVVVTVEPGIYFIDSLLAEAARNTRARKHINWDRLDQLRAYGGIRIEDDVVTTDSEPENLTRNAFHCVSNR